MDSAFYEDFAFFANFCVLVFFSVNEKFVEIVLVTASFSGVLSRSGVDLDPAPPCVFHISRRKRKRSKTVKKHVLSETLPI